MKNKLNIYLLFPVILIYITFLKGMKKEYKNFFENNDKKPKGDNILSLRSKAWKFFDLIEYFFDKTSAFYNKVLLTFEIDINKSPETKNYLRVDFYFVLKFFYATSILSKRTSNDNINIALEIENKKKLYDDQINHLIRYHLIAYGSGRVDTLYFDKESLKDQRSKLAYDTMLSYLDGAKLINFSTQKHLFVLTIEKNTKKYDIVWSSEDDIELTDFNDVYDKYGNLMKKDIKISNSPIYASHK